MPAQTKGIINNWSRRHTSARQQAQAISFLFNRIEYYESINFHVPFDRIFDECASNCNISKATARRFWLHFEQYGELPDETEEYLQRVRAKSKWLPKSAKINQAELGQLKSIIDNRPDLFLDEIALVFGIQTGKYLNHATIWRYMTKYLNYSLQSLTELASQQCEIKRDEFRYQMDITLLDNPDLLVMVDETHRDRNASRRRRGYGKRNGGGLMFRRWFKNEVRFTMIAAADINGFIDVACGTWERDELSDEGAAGTVTREIFEEWVENKLCPVLGDYTKGENRSVVMLDNASTHMSQKVIDLITAKNARIIFSAPFSPDLNPIENYFSVYKKYLKKHNMAMTENWQKVHWEALATVNRDMGICYFRRCGIPGSINLKTTEEKNKEEEEAMNVLALIMMIEEED